MPTSASMSAARATSKKQDVLISVGRRKAEKQPAEFVLCPLGVQFYSSKKIPDWTLMELNVNVPVGGRKKSAKKVTCTGAVVRCQKESSKGYRVWIKFLDLDKEHSERLKCAAKDGCHLCSFCENF